MRARPSPRDSRISLADTYTLYLKTHSFHWNVEGPMFNTLHLMFMGVKGHEAVARTARKVFPIAEQGHDESTVDLLTQRLQVHEKMAWMLRRLLT